MVRYNFFNAVVFVILSASCRQHGKANDERCIMDSDIIDRGYDGDLCVNDRLYPPNAGQTESQAPGNAGIFQYEVSSPRPCASDAFLTSPLNYPMPKAPFVKAAYHGWNFPRKIWDIVPGFFEEQMGIYVLHSGYVDNYGLTGDINSTLEPPLRLERGHWQATNASTDILACFNTEACVRGSREEQSFCSKGYEGPHCSVCSEGYTASLGFVCNKCPDNVTGGIVLVAAMATIVLLTFAAFLSYLFSEEMEDTSQGLVTCVTRFLPLQSIKIVIVMWQILTRMSAVAYVVFPGVYQRFLNSVDALNFDISWVLSAGCIIDTDFHDQLLLATLGPLVCIAILGVTYIAAMRRSHDSEEARQIIHRKFVSMVILITFLVYSSVSSTVFKTFACEDLEDGKNYLRADYRIECDSSKHKALEIYAGLMIVLYVVGIPAFYGVLLYKYREPLTKSVGREEDEIIKPIANLWKPYRPERFYYEVIECTRRVLMTGALVFIYPNTAAQIAVALMMALLFIFVSEALAPYASMWDTWCSRSGHAIVYTSMFLALLLKVNVSEEHSRSQRVFEWVLVTAHTSLVLVIVAEAVVIVMAWRWEVKEDTEPRIRPSPSVLSHSLSRVGKGETNFPPL